MRFLVALVVTALPFVAWKLAPMVEPDAKDDWQIRVAITVLLVVAAVCVALGLFALGALWKWAL